MTIGSMITGGLTSLLSGGMLGIFGAIGTGVLDFFKVKQKNKQDLEIMDKQLEFAKAAGSNAALLETIKLMGSSYEHDKATYQNAGYVDVVRGLVRPAITLYLVAVASVIALWAFKKVGLEQVVVSEVAKYSIYSCLELAGICIVWYFGGRETRKVNGR